MRLAAEMDGTVRKIFNVILSFSLAIFLLSTILYNHELKNAVRYDDKICHNNSLEYSLTYVKGKKTCISRIDSKYIEDLYHVALGFSIAFGITLSIVLFWKSKKSV